jgi:hypothetical protein
MVICQAYDTAREGHGNNARGPTGLIKKRKVLLTR